MSIWIASGDWWTMKSLLNDVALNDVDIVFLPPVATLCLKLRKSLRDGVLCLRHQLTSKVDPRPAQSYESVCVLKVMYW